MPASDESGPFIKSKIPKRLKRDDLLPKYFPHAYPDTKKLYVMHFCFAFASRMWDMGIVLLVAIITNNSLFLVAICGFLSSLFICLFMPIVGSYLDKSSRMASVQTLLTAKIIIVSLAYLFCAYLSDITVDRTTSTSKIALYSIPVCCAIAGVSFNAITQSIEKDWIVVLSDGDSTWLTNTNSIMSQIDLGCASFAPAITGVLFTYCYSGDVAAILLLFNAITTICLFLFMRGLYHSWPALAVRHGYDDSRSHTATPTLTGFEETTPLPWCAQFIYFLHDFLNSGCAGVMISYAFVYLTVLSFGSLMTVYLLWAGISPQWIGVFRGVAALTGFTGAIAFPYINKHLGLYKTAQLSVTYQCLFVVIAASSFFWGSSHVSVMVLVVAVLLSRTGLWMFDLSVRQIAQETIHESVRGKVNGQWKAMTAFFDMTCYFIAVLIPHPNDFWILSCISASMIFLAMVTFTITNPFSALSCYPAKEEATRPSNYRYYDISNSAEEKYKDVDTVDIEMRNTRKLAYQADDE